MSTTIELTKVKLLQKPRTVQLTFADGQQFVLSCEYLRVFSPSAEVRGHAGTQGKLQLNKQDVNITSIEPVGNYALRFVFDDGHATGIYTWEYLYELGQKQQSNWQDYLQRVADLTKGGLG